MTVMPENQEDKKTVDIESVSVADVMGEKQRPNKPKPNQNWTKKIKPSNN